MSDITFGVVRAELTVEVKGYGFTSGWYVVRFEPGEDDQLVSRLYPTQGEAQKRADELRKQQEKKDA